jgi:hypothetical protein
MEKDPDKRGTAEELYNIGVNECVKNECINEMS